jgi:Alpha-2-macroglobulin family
LKFKIEEADRGGIHTQITYIKDNRLYQEQFEVQVPWKNKELTIEYQSFRDKLLPGQEEEWRIKISGSKKEKVAAEMVAALYDASLDQFARNSYSLNPFPSLSYNQYAFNGNNFGIAEISKSDNTYYDTNNAEDKSYKILRWFDYWYSNQYLNDAAMPMTTSASIKVSARSAPMGGKMGSAEVRAYKINGNAKLEDSVDSESVSLSNDKAEDKKPSDPVVTPRTNLKETVFFLPNLMTDAEGNVIIKFKMNEALTKWRFLALAHTQDLKIASSEKEIVTQKDLMVMPNAPRFMREGDVFYFSSKITNLSDKDISGTVKLELFDAVTDQPVNVLLNNTNNILQFSALKGQSTAVSWRLNIPVGKINALTWRVTAISGNQSDGEQNALPVLSNRSWRRNQRIYF